MEQLKLRHAALCNWATKNTNSHQFSRTQFHWNSHCLYWNPLLWLNSCKKEPKTLTHVFIKVGVHRKHLITLNKHGHLKTGTARSSC